MADPRMFDVSVAVGFEEAQSLLAGLLEEGVPDATQPFAERYANPYLPGSPASLLEATTNDAQVRAAHGEKVMISNLVRVVAHLRRRVEELEAAKLKTPKAAAKK